jgi:hypothetical protein
MDAALPDVLVRLSADCPRRGDFSNPCGAIYLESIGTTVAERAGLGVEIEAARSVRR